MSMGELKKLLSEGKITKEQFDAMAKAMDPGYVPEPPEKPPEGESTQNDDTPPSADIEKLIQQAVDRATNKLGNDNKKLRKELETLQKEKLSAEELRDLEIQNREQDIAEREKSLQEKENRLYAIKAIKKAGLDDGSDVSLELVDFVLAKETSEIDARIQAFDKLLKKLVKAEVDKTFRANGRNPQSGGSAARTANPYAKDTFNLSEQMKLEMENPELAKQLQAAAGSK